MTAQTTDCLVLGGGPAGSSFASTLLRHAPDVRVTVLEQAHFPRWQVGESVVPLINAQLRELGIFERVLESGVVKKIGNVVVWGPTRKPWSPDFLLLDHARAGDPAVHDIPGFDYRPLAGSGLPLDQPVTSFNVRRSEFDTLLLDRSRELGADVRQGARATRIQQDALGKIESVHWVDDRGGTGEIRPQFVVDACGLRSPLTRGKRHRDRALRHCAIVGYLRGARWKASYRAGERAAVFVLSVEKGWIWYIPIAEDSISVGLVCDAALLRQHRDAKSQEALLWTELERAPELSGVVRHARLCEDVLPNRARVRVCQQWSSFVEVPFGPNWVAVGDAAMFVDPIVPSGVGFAMQSGHRAAYTWLTARARPDVAPAELWQAYAWYVRGEYGAMSQLARFLYANNDGVAGAFWQRPLLEAWRLSVPSQCTLSSCDFFPFPKAFGWKVVAPWLSGLTGAPGKFEGVYDSEGLSDDLSDMNYEVQTPLLLALRTEYPTDGSRNGLLRIYRDVVTPSQAFYHRLAVRPADLPLRLEPVVRALSAHGNVQSLLAAAPSLLSATWAERPALDRAVKDLLRVVARRGFIRMSRGAAV